MPGSSVRLWLRPGLLGLHVLLVVAVTGCVIGGLWQYGAYEREQSQERVERSAMAPVPLQEVWPVGEPFTAELDHRRVEVRGTFGAAADQLWVSGRHQGGQDGFWLLAPLVVDGAGEALLVVRGFAPEVGDLPPVPAGTQNVTAILRPSEGEGAALDDRRVVGTVRVPSLLNELDMPLYSGFAVATSDTGAGLALAEEPEPDVSWTVGLTNLAYALQWWAFALFAVFMWWRMCTDQVAQARAAVPVPDDP
ncbi:SURF1 family protein [Aeromicrobium sp. CTD01-1L150]|uniref:SURF1 family protein n=1 Tax=Aeromicrobium sp. CTD01-1L150 TaxID=3341830 RepID=UPI0035BF8F1D